MKYLNYITAGVLIGSSLYAKDLPENNSWSDNFRFSPRLGLTIQIILLNKYR